jgi:hypothetical protein
MATVGIQLGLEVTDLQELQKTLGQIFKAADKAKIVKDALKKAIAPTEARLKQVAPIGPTGNLQRAVASRIIPYNKTGNAVAVVGFRRADKEKFFSAQGGSVRKGSDLAYHQYWLERGTKARPIRSPSPPKSYVRPGYNKPGFERQTYTMNRRGKAITVRGHSVRTHAVAGHVVDDPNEYYYASSFNRLGAFKIQKFRQGEKGFITTPGYPNAFFKKSKKGVSMTIPPMPVGGSTGQPPLETAWNQTQATVAEILSRELNIALSRALDSLTRSTQTLESVT